MRWFYVFSLMVLASCTAPEVDDKPTVIPEDIEVADPYIDMDLKSAVNAYVRKELNLSANDLFEYEIYRGNCDGDDSLDYVIAVNLLDKALDDAIASGNPAKRAEIGYMGRYNFFFYADGFTRKFGSLTCVPSSPHAKLKVAFENHTSEKKKDIFIDYRIQNSGWRNYYMLSNGVPLQIFQAQLFDGIGDMNAVGYKITYEKGSISDVPDIIIYKGTFKNIKLKDPMEVYSFEPEITAGNIVYMNCFFNPKDQKYYVRQ